MWGGGGGGECVITRILDCMLIINISPIKIDPENIPTDNSFLK